MSETPKKGPYSIYDTGVEVKLVGPNEIVRVVSLDLPDHESDCACITTTGEVLILAE